LVYFQPHIDTKVNKLQKNFTHLTVLVAPLDWGLGHTTRCIPIISALLQQGCRVILAGEHAQQAIFQQEFPQIKVVGLKGYGIRYSANGNLFFFKLIQQIPKILHAIIGENRWLKRVVEAEKIDLIIADNRYGLYHKKIPSVFITHQLQLHLKNRFLERVSQLLLYRWINKFSYCWLPDMVDGITGKLSHPTKLPTIPIAYINLLSRFSIIQTEIKYKYCFLISGPEPQRSIFEEKVFELVSSIDEPVAIVRGVPNAKDRGPWTVDGIENTDQGLQSAVYGLRSTVYPHLPTTALSILVQQSEFIVCRGGYTSLMELLVLKKKLIVVPTPSQTEQEYLAEILMQQNNLFVITQSLFNKKTLDQATSFPYSFSHLKSFDEADMHQLLSSICIEHKIHS
jgi:UDP-N-acetylglucosamine transferase subunit ALG13